MNTVGKMITDNVLLSPQEPPPDVAMLSCKRNITTLEIHARDNIVEYVGTPSATRESACDALANLTATVPASVTHVRLLGLPCVQQAALQQLLERCPQLESLEMPASEEPTAEPLCPAEHDSIQLVAQRLSRPAGAWTLQQLPVTLTHLSLSHCGSLHPSSFTHLRGLTALKRLCIRGLWVPPPSPTSLPGQLLSADGLPSGGATARRESASALVTALASASASASAAGAFDASMAPGMDANANGYGDRVQQKGSAAGPSSLSPAERDVVRMATVDGVCEGCSGAKRATVTMMEGKTDRDRGAELPCCPIISSLQHWSRLTRLQDVELVGQAGDDPGDPWDALLPAFLPSLPHITRLAFHPPALHDASASLAPLELAASLVRLELGGCGTAPLQLHEGAWRVLAAVPTLKQLLVGHCAATIGDALAAAPEGFNGSLKMAYSSAAAGLGLAAAASLSSWAAAAVGSGGGGSLPDGRGADRGVGWIMGRAASGRGFGDGSDGGLSYGGGLYGGGPTTPEDSPVANGGCGHTDWLKGSGAGGPASDGHLGVRLSDVQPIQEWSWDRHCSGTIPTAASTTSTAAAAQAISPVLAIVCDPCDPSASSAVDGLSGEMGSSAIRDTWSAVTPQDNGGEFWKETSAALSNGEVPRDKCVDLGAQLTPRDCYRGDTRVEHTGLDVLSLSSVSPSKEEDAAGAERYDLAVPLVPPRLTPGAAAVLPAVTVAAEAMAAAREANALVLRELGGPLSSLPGKVEGEAIPRSLAPACTGIATPSDRTSSVAVSAEPSCVGSSSVPSSRSSYCINMTRCGVVHGSSSVRRVSEGGYSWCSSCANDDIVVAVAVAAAAAAAGDTHPRSRDVEGSRHPLLLSLRESYPSNAGHAAEPACPAGALVADDGSSGSGDGCEEHQAAEAGGDADADGLVELIQAAGTGTLHSDGGGGGDAGDGGYYDDDVDTDVKHSEQTVSSDVLPARRGSRFITFQEEPLLQQTDQELSATTLGGACGIEETEMGECTVTFQPVQTEAEIVAAALTAAAAFRATTTGFAKGSLHEVIVSGGGCDNCAGSCTGMTTASTSVADNADACSADVDFATPAPVTVRKSLNACRKLSSPAVTATMTAAPLPTAAAAALAAALTIAAGSVSSSTAAGIKRANSAAADLGGRSSCDHSAGVHLDATAVDGLQMLGRTRQRGVGYGPFSSLQRLSLLHIGDEDLALLASCIPLQDRLLSLSLADSSGLGEGGMKSVARFRHLEHLSLRGLKATFDPIIGSWTNLSELRALEIGLSPTAAVTLAAAADAAVAANAAGSPPPPLVPLLTSAPSYGGGAGLGGKWSAEPWGEAGLAGPSFGVDGSADGVVTWKGFVSSRTLSGDSDGRADGSTWGKWPSPAEGTATELADLQAALCGTPYGSGGGAGASFDRGCTNVQLLYRDYDDDLDATVAMVAAAGGFTSDADDTAAGGSTYAEAICDSGSSRRSSDVGAICSDHHNDYLLGTEEDNLGKNFSVSADGGNISGFSTDAALRLHHPITGQDFGLGMNARRCSSVGATAIQPIGLNEFLATVSHRGLDGDENLRLGPSPGPSSGSPGRRQQRDFIPANSECPVGLWYGRGSADSGGDGGGCFDRAGLNSPQAAVANNDPSAGFHRSIVRQGSPWPTSPVCSGAGGFTSVASAARVEWDVVLGAGTAVRWAAPMAVQDDVATWADCVGEERVQGAHSGVAAVAAAAGYGGGGGGAVKEEVPSGCILTDNGLQLLLQMLPRLQELYLHNLPHLVPATLEIVLSRPGLRTLVVDGCRHLTPEFCELLSVSAMDLIATGEGKAKGPDEDAEGSGLRLLLVPS